jgi:hypothetical protein
MRLSNRLRKYKKKAKKLMNKAESILQSMTFSLRDFLQEMAKEAKA